MGILVFESESPVNRSEDPVDTYKQYLQRYIKNKEKTMSEANQEYLCREVGKEYGVTEEELQELEIEFLFD